jgi:uncharacterized membrane protein
MTPVHADRMVQEYLDRLAAAASGLPAPARGELVSEIRAHLDAALPADATPMQVRVELDRLGSPEEIAAAAGADEASPRGGRAPAPRGLLLEIAAVLLLLVGGLVVPVVGWCVGVVLLWSSGRWSTKEKLLGTFVVPGGLLLPFALAYVVPGESCSSATSGGPDGPGVTVEETCTGFSFPLFVGIPLVIFLSAHRSSSP